MPPGRTGVATAELRGHVNTPILVMCLQIPTRAPRVNPGYSLRPTRVIALVVRLGPLCIQLFMSHPNSDSNLLHVAFEWPTPSLSLNLDSSFLISYYSYFPHINKKDRTLWLI